jgi:flagellum-specific peptidoglycan hydrolase FlgJ
LDKQSFLNMIKEHAQELASKGVLASTQIAQAILESGWGTSGLSKDAYNLFGIKGVGSAGSVTYPTKEYVNGHWVTVNAQFRKYFNFAQSINDHVNFLVQNARYKSLIGDTDYKSVCKKLQACGYATDPNYANQLISIIEDNDLTQFDAPQVKIDRLLKIGCEGEDVKLLQNLLNHKGFTLVVDGSFGVKTDQAVRDFQSKHALAVDGIVGQNTLKALQEG